MRRTHIHLSTNLTYLVLIMIALTLLSIHNTTGRIFAIEQPSTMEGINEDECDKIMNCKIVSRDVLKYPDIVDPFGKIKDISITMMNNLNDSQKMEQNTCQKFMDVDIVKTKDQQIGEKTPKYLICLP